MYSIPLMPAFCKRHDVNRRLEMLSSNINSDPGLITTNDVLAEKSDFSADMTDKGGKEAVGK